MRRWHTFLKTVGGACLVGFALAAQANTFPSRPITIVAPYPPGGATDLYARSVADGLTAGLGQPAIVENRAGASGMIGAEYVSRQQADGYTLMIGASSMYSILPLLSDKMKDAADRIEPVALVGINPSYVVVPASLPVNDIQELIDYLKAAPGAHGYASAGQGTSQHVFMELFKQQAGVDVFHVPYKGSGPMVVDLVAGRVVMGIEQGPAVLSHIKSGRLKALAVTTPTRAAALPDVPTLAETALPGFDATTWFAVYAPAGLPKDVLHKLNEQISKTMTSPEVKERLMSFGVEPAVSTPEELAERQREETSKWGDVIKRSAITLSE